MTKTPWGPVGYLTYKRTYARRVDANATEEFEQTVDRIMSGCRDQLKVGFTPEEEAEVKGYFLGLKGLPAGRFLWQLGTDTVERLGMASLQNCSLCVIDDPIRPFTWAMDMLMLGSGVGYNLQREYVYSIKEKVSHANITRQDNAQADYLVPDTREGWCKLLGKVLKAHFYGSGDFTYSTHCIRGSGAAIKGFGGTASGPEILCQGMEKISGLLNRRAALGGKFQPIDALDVMNIIGSIVVAGNVRRSAQISIGDADDIEFLNAKRWDRGDIPNWRAMSNNSIVCNDISTLPETYWEGFNRTGELYGLINIRLSRAVGRLGEGAYRDSNVAGYNPCAEQSLEPWETCCLGEFYLPNIHSAEELERVVKYLYRICKHSLAIQCHHPETQAVVHKNYRMGIGPTGYLQSSDEQRGWLSGVYRKLRLFDVEYSKAHGFPTSIKLTTCKPSGTLSLLAGVTPGVHPGFSQYFIRRIQIASDSELVSICKSKGYKVEFRRHLDGTNDHGTVVVEFPCSYPEGTVLAKDTTAVQQLEYVKKLQTDWSDNSVSCTVYYRKEEVAEIRKWLTENYNDGTKTISFLLHSGHGFDQAPFEEITKAQFDELSAKVQPITDLALVSEDDVSINEECDSGACPIK